MNLKSNVEVMIWLSRTVSGEVLRPESLRNIVEMIPSTSGQAIYIGIQEDTSDSLAHRHQIS